MNRREFLGAVGGAVAGAAVAGSTPGESGPSTEAPHRPTSIHTVYGPGDLMGEARRIVRVRVTTIVASGPAASALTAYNQTSSPVVLTRLGMTVPASGSLILTNYAWKHEIQMDGSLHAAVNAGKILLTADADRSPDEDLAGVGPVAVPVEQAFRAAHEALRRGEVVILDLSKVPLTTDFARLNERWFPALGVGGGTLVCLLQHCPELNLRMSDRVVRTSWNFQTGASSVVEKDKWGVPPCRWCGCVDAPHVVELRHSAEEKAKRAACYHHFLDGRDDPSGMVAMALVDWDLILSGERMMSVCDGCHAQIDAA